MDWTMFTAISGVVVITNGFVLWMMSKLDNDIRSLSADSNAKWVAMNTRIDQTQAIIMRMLEKQGK